MSSSGRPVAAQSGHVFEDEGTPLAQRSNANFTGAGVTVSDSGGKTVINIPGGGSSNIQDGTADGQIGVWNDTAGVYEPTDVDTAVAPADIGAAAASDLTAHLNDTSDAHDAGAISTTGITGLAGGSASNVQTILAALKTYADGLGGGGGGAASLHGAAVYGLKTWNFDPWDFNEATLQNGGVLITGTIIVPYDTSITGIAAVAKTAGAGLTVAYGALWNLAGTTRVAKTASQTTNWQSAGYKKAAFAGGPVALTAGIYIFGLLTTGTTATEWRAKIAGDTVMANLDTADPAYRAAYMFPADDTTATLTGLTATVKQPWVGLY